MRFRPLFYLLSGIFISVSIYSILVNKFKIGIDFTGGATWEINTTLSDQKLKSTFEDNKVKVISMSKTDKGNLIIKTPQVEVTQKIIIEESIKLQDKDYKETRFETQGPSLGQELIRKTIAGALLASLVLLLFIGNTFKDLSFGLAAVLAMFHDVIILAGAFSVFGKIYGAEIDSLFVTALLTTLSASVHDTVVTFDRIREIRRNNHMISWGETANMALSQTIVRSLNNSMTIIIMLTSLVALGSETTRWFGAALLVGAISGTYSSFAIAVPLVVWLKSKKNRS